MEKMIANTVINLHSLLLSKLYQDSNVPSSVRRTLRSSLKIRQHCSKSSCLPLNEVNKKTKPVVMMDQMYKKRFLSLHWKVMFIMNSILAVSGVFLQKATSVLNVMLDKPAKSCLCMT